MRIERLSGQAGIPLHHDDLDRLARALVRHSDGADLEHVGVR